MKCYTNINSRSQAPVHTVPVFIDSISTKFECVDKLTQNDAEHTEKFCIPILTRILSKLNAVVLVTKLTTDANGNSAQQAQKTSVSKLKSSVSKSIHLQELEKGQFTLKIVNNYFKHNSTLNTFDSVKSSLQENNKSFDFIINTSGFNLLNK